MAVGACAFALDATQGALNRLLEASGIEPVIARAGVEWGRTDFACTGTRDANEINVLGFPTNFAAWCEKKATGWEVVVGEGAGDKFDDDLVKRHPDSPKSFQHKGERRYWRYSLFHWSRIVSEAASTPSELDRRATSSIGLRY